MTDPRPRCPFCAAAWSDAMLGQFEAMSSPCSCCGGPAAAQDAATMLPMPSEDLCCASCGRAIYLNPHGVA